MRVFLMRFTVRRIMVVVAIVGLTLAGTIEVRRRRERFFRVADFHERHNPYIYPGYYTIPVTPLLNWHERMGEKYRRAASRPWLPVQADPPPPTQWKSEFGSDLPSLDVPNGDDPNNPFR